MSTNVQLDLSAPAFRATLLDQSRILVSHPLCRRNGDPEQFSAPEHLDITRSENRRLAFGYGIHFCVDAPLVHLEGKIAINAILQRLPNLQLGTSSVDWQDVIVTRGLKTLPVVI